MRLNSERFQLGLFARRTIVLVAMVAALPFPVGAFAQADSKAVVAPGAATAGPQDVETKGSAAAPEDEPAANPGRPTVSTPATLTPVGYLQFETGLLGAWHSPEFSSQASLGVVTKFSVSHRLQLLAATGPYVHSDTQPANGSGDVSLGAQGVIRHGKGAHPTLSLSYFHRVLNGGTPDLDMGSPSNSAVFLASADVKGFHYDTNYLLTEVEDDQGVRRAQYAQTLSISHGLAKKIGVSGEIWDFTQPFLRGRAVGNLWAVNYNVRKNLVFDLAFNRGLTATSTRWELLAGFTYLLPDKVHLR